jgi:acyl-CoA reductase-like NAD-dependent aldehyde dehydrogenase
VVAGGGSTAGAALVRHPDVDKISFTGSTEVGRGIMRAAADTNKRLTLELGGKSPNIVFADADLKAAARGVQTGIFYGKGEVCAAGSRLLVERAVHDPLVELLAEGARKLTPGDPLDKNTRLGALVSKGSRRASWATSSGARPRVPRSSPEATRPAPAAAGISSRRRCSTA